MTFRNRLYIDRQISCQNIQRWKGYTLTLEEWLLMGRENKKWDKTGRGSEVLQAFMC